MNDFVFENRTCFYFGREGISRVADELGFTADIFEPCAEPIACLPFNFKQLATDDVKAIPKTSMR